MSIPKGTPLIFNALLKDAVAPLTAEIIGGAALQTQPTQVGTTDFYQISLSANEMDAECLTISLLDDAGETYGITIVTDYDMSTVETDIGSIALDIGSIDDNVLLIQQDIDAVEIDVDAIAEDIVAIELDIDAIETVTSTIDATLNNLLVSGELVIGQGVGSVHYTDNLDFGPNRAKDKIIVKAYLVTNTIPNWSEIKGLDVTDILGRFDLWLDPGDYLLRLEKNGVGIDTIEVTIS